MEKKSLRDAKEVYKAIPIPGELDETVRAALRSSRPEPQKRHFMRYAVSLAAGACAVFMLAVNTSQAFAQSLYGLPVIGNIARVFTFVQYEKEEDADVLRVRLPAISSTGNTELEQRVNYEIQLKMNQLVDEARQRAKEYKKAFLETGGKEKDYMPVEIFVDYDIHLNDGVLLSFTITKAETSASYYGEQFFYNVDLESGRDLTLRDLLGPDYIHVVNSSVQKQMKERMAADPDQFYFTEEDEKFTTITPDQGFYLNDKGNVVVVFPKYEIAPGYMGIQEFEIPTP